MNLKTTLALTMLFVTLPPLTHPLQSLTPRYGKYAILGNHDLTASVNNKSLQLLEAGG